MKKVIFIIISFWLFSIYGQKTNLAPTLSVTDVYHGIKIIDPYRNLENLKDETTMAWMKSQTDYTNSILNQLPKRAYYLKKRLEFDKRQGYSISDLKITGNDKYFYLKKNATEKIAKLYFRDGFQGKEQLLYSPSSFISTYSTSNNHEFVINYISPSKDGSRIAIAMSENGKEMSEMVILNVNDKTTLPEIITNIQPSNVGGVQWLDDNNAFLYVYYPEMDTKSKIYNKNTETILYKIGTDPKNRKDIFSTKNNPELHISDSKYPIILDYNDQYYIGMILDYDEYRKTYIIPKEDLLAGKKNWKQFYGKDDKVRSLQLLDQSALFLSKYDSPNYKLCKTDVKKPNFKTPEILIPERKDEVIKSFKVTTDGIYYTTTKNGVESKLYFYKDGKDQQILLPYSSGDIEMQVKDEKSSDIWITCSGWANDKQRFKYNIKNNTFKTENLVPSIDYPEFKDIVVEEQVVKSRDGEEIPISLIYNKNLKKDGKAPLLIDAYGAYGISRSPFFARIYLLWAGEGGIFAVAHVRGGGEKGEKWRLGGHKNTKPNSWKDLIDCTEYLIKEKYSSKEKIAIWGASAGGITVGRAMTERPDLFKAVILEVGMVNAVRDEIAPNSNIEEFGSVKDPAEFKDLLEMDAYLHIKKGIKYPSTLITGGINDERVAVWEPAKFAAKLIKDDESKNPILLQVDFEGGHGNNTAIIHAHSNLSDIFAFAAWQLGIPGYQPK
ncbi:prolyl oligopeptidase family serine peptidase [Chryseobacterium paridis]|uniref:prolyl oligopeptidase n=1 Tax=Chryseobacterium paridis TaxID=2800328 RepID=A0ABS1FUP9_9FLAO|nr:prolyl oligopeptidase family serine peptidase [Chryseobacterium paridis]MBK1896144.1 prolyl oligopeptidase family serine peptidase [Chryseobacterium paridis]